MEALGGSTVRRSVCVLDFESCLSTDAQQLISPGDHAGLSRSMLLEVTAVSLLRFDMNEDGIDAISLASAADPTSERDMLLMTEDGLASMGVDGLLVTHNGVAHDIRLAFRRCMSHWLLDVPGIRRFADAGPNSHFDTMLRFGGRGAGRAGVSLLDLCAGLGVPALVPPAGRRHHVHPLIRKGQVDVAATAVAFLHWEAMRRGSPRWLAAAWRDLGRHLLVGGGRADHLLPIARRGLELGDALAARG